MAFELDTSVLMPPPGPSPVARAQSHLGGIIDAIVARRDAQAQAEQARKAKEAELAFRQAQEARLRQKEQQEAEQFRSEQEAKARAERAGAVRTAAEMERQGSGGAVPAYLGAMGGTLAPKKVSEVDEMLAKPDPQLLAAGDTGDVGMLGLAQSMAERARSNQATAANEDAVRGKQILSWGDGSQSEYAPADDGSDLERRLSGLNQNDPKVVRAIAEARAAKLQGKDTLNYIENERKRQATIEAARIRAAAKGRGGGAGKPMTTAQAAADARGYNTAADGLLNQHLQREDYKPTLAALRESKVLLDGLTSTNAAAQKRALGIWAKQASGPGAVQQSERDEFVNTVGGMDEKLKSAAMKWLSGGHVPEEQLAIFTQAVKDITMKRQQETLSSIQDDVRDMFATYPDPKMQKYADWAANRVGRQFMPRASTTAPSKTDALHSEADALLRGLR